MCYLAEGLNLDRLRGHESPQGAAPRLPPTLPSNDQLDPLQVQEGLQDHAVDALMVSWQIWKERNACVFRAKLSRVSDVLHAIKNDLELWRLAGATCLEPPFGEEAVR